MHRALIAMVFLFVFSGCKDQLYYASFQSTSDTSWDRDEVFEFSFSDPDTTRAHQLFINLRNDNNYPYSNLFIIAEMEFPDGKTQRDTLEYEMADASGQWLGSGYGSVRENKLWYKEDVVFPTSGVYTINLSHAMRKNGQVEGIQSLPGIVDVGLQIEKKE